MVTLNKNMSPFEKIMYEILLDGEAHSKEGLSDLCKPSAPRDIIKSLRGKHGLLIHGRGNWRLDERHISGDRKAVIVATAEAKAKHSSNSVKMAKRESERLPQAYERNERIIVELAGIKEALC